MKKLLPIFLVVFVIFSNLDTNGIVNFRARGELSFLELIQAFIISLCLFFQIKLNKGFIIKSNKVSYFGRLILFVFLLYEEISFVTNNSQNEFLNTISTQSEVNLHNSTFLFHNLFSFSIPYLNKTAYLNSYVLFITISLTIIGFGSYFNFLKKFRYFFIEPKLSLYSLIFLLNIPLTGILNFINPSLIFLKGEFCELFIYILLLIDTLEKKRRFKLN